MPSRRQVLAAGCLALAGGAGCSQLRDAVETGGDGTERGGTETTTEDEGTTTADATAETTADAAEETTADTAEKTTTAEASRFRVTVTDDDREVELVTGEDVATVGEIEPARTGDGYRIPVELTDEGTQAFADGLDRVGALENPDPHRIRTYFEGEMLYEAKLGRGLADAIESGEFDGSFLFHVSDRETAEEVKDALETQ